MKIFEEPYLDFLHTYDLVGLSYFLFMILIIFTPMLLGALALIGVGFMTGKIQKRIKTLARFVHIQFKKFRRRKLHPAVLIDFRHRLAIIRTLF